MNLLAGAALTNTVVFLSIGTSCFPLVKNTDDAGIRAVILGVDALTLTQHDGLATGAVLLRG